MKNMIIANNGSIQNIPVGDEAIFQHLLTTLQSIPEDIKKLYLTVWEMSQRDIIDMAADRLD